MSAPDPESTPRRPSIVTLGDLLLDVVIEGDISVASDAPGMLDVFPGGSAANFASVAANLAANVRFIGRVGDDAAGRLLIHDLAASGVETRVRAVPGLRSGNVLVLRNIDGLGGSRMRSNPGASATLSPEDLDPAWFTNIHCLHLSGYSFLRPGPRGAALAALALCRQESPNALLSLDPGPAHLIADADPVRFRELIAELQFDLLLPNYEEGSLLAGTENPAAIIASLLELAPLVVLKLGAAGSLVGVGEERYREAAAPVEVIDTTGAGDAFAAGFVVALLKGGVPAEAARAGALAAAGVVGRSGAR